MLTLHTRQGRVTVSFTTESVAVPVVFNDLGKFQGDVCAAPYYGYSSAWPGAYSTIEGLFVQVTPGVLTSFASVPTVAVDAGSITTTGCTLYVARPAGASGSYTVVLWIEVSGFVFI